MKDLKLPVFKTPDIPAKKMTMTAYAKFVLDGLKSLKNADRTLLFLNEAASCFATGRRRP